MRRKASLRDLLSLSKPKGPGFGIDKGFYLSILSGTAVMPSVFEVVNPKGEGGAVMGFGVPLGAGSSKDDLALPMARGAFAIASPDQKSVLKMLVMSKEEARFDPTPLLASPSVDQFGSEVKSRIASTWMVAQVTFESFEASVGPSIDFVYAVSARLAALTTGVIADPVSRRYLLPDWNSAGVSGPLQAVGTLVTPTTDGWTIATHGMQKFGLAEFEATVREESLTRTAASLLLGAAASRLSGQAMDFGDVIGRPGQEFQLGRGGIDTRYWEGDRLVFCLLPATGTMEDALRAIQHDLV